MKQYLKYWCSPGYPGDPLTTPLAQLDFHIDVNHRGKHICDICFKFFSDPDSLNVHTTRCVHEEQQRYYNCAECGKDFKYSQYLKSHIKCVHEGRKDYKCTECGKAFDSTSNLKKHTECEGCFIKKLKGRRDYVCKQCYKDFKSASHLNRHIKQIHEAQRDCKQCGKDFSTAGNLKKHIKLVHEGRRDYKCSEKIILL